MAAGKRFERVAPATPLSRTGGARLGSSHFSPSTLHPSEAPEAGVVPVGLVFQAIV